MPHFRVKIGKMHQFSLNLETLGGGGTGPLATLLTQALSFHIQWCQELIRHLGDQVNVFCCHY